LKTKAIQYKPALRFAAVSLCVALILLAIDFSVYASAHARQIAGAVLLALLAMAVVRLATNAMAARESNVLEHAPEMSSLSFPPSSLRR
jgi:hypothetical protein